MFSDHRIGPDGRLRPNLRRSGDDGGGVNVQAWAAVGS